MTNPGAFYESVAVGQINVLLVRGTSFSIVNVYRNLVQGTTAKAQGTTAKAQGTTAIAVVFVGYFKACYIKVSL